MKSAEEMTEQVKKYGNEEKFPRMRGTQGGLDYLIIAKDPANHCQLGIKALIGMGSVEGQSAILIGFRLRSAFIPGEQESNVTSIDSADEEKPEQPEAKNLAEAIH